ncbi:MAG: hypothetical protein V1729_02020 [Candidatus Woesearchaeota archaeon]
MGWFQKISSIFGSEEEVEDAQPEEAAVDLAGLSSWIEDRSNLEYDKIKPEIMDQFSRFFDEKKTLLGILDTLHSAELHNPDIPEKERQFMVGNRVAYISQHKQFLNMLNISDDPNCKETAAFCSDFEDSLVKLAKSTARNHAILSQFFANHMSSANRSIKTMGDCISRIKEILEDGNVGVDAIDHLRKAAAELYGKQRLLSELNSELEMLNTKLVNSDQMKQKFQGKIDELKQTEDYAGFKSRNEEREAQWAVLKQIDEEVSSIFSQLSKPMKRYERVVVEDAPLFSRYLEDPMSALVDDEALKIMGILQKMSSSMESGSLEVKDADKAIQRVGDLDAAMLRSARDRYMDAKSIIKKIDDEMRNIGVLENLNDLQYKIEHVDNQIKILHDKIGKSEHTLSKIDLDTLREHVQKKLLDELGVKVAITW